MDDSEVRAEDTGERSELAAMLDELTEARWDEETLCSGWRVREVAAHITMPFRYSPLRFIGGMAAARGNFNRMADRAARRDTERLSSRDLLESLRQNVDHPWKPPGGGFLGALSHDIIHGLDISVPLGTGRHVPEKRLRMVLDNQKPKQIGYFGVDLNGIRLQATDLDWSCGEGEPLAGLAQHLLLVQCGRRLPAGLLTGKAAAQFTR
jgi:uncharacterized protein (TIGR03083 family)